MPSELKKPEPAQKAVYADAFNTPAVKHGSEQGGYLKTPDYYTAAQLEQYAADRVREALEAIADEYAMRLQSDLEHGVRWLNEKAARDFNQTYIGLAGFMGWLNDRTLKEQTK